MHKTITTLTAAALLAGLGACSNSTSNAPAPTAASTKAQGDTSESERLNGVDSEDLPPADASPLAIYWGLKGKPNQVFGQSNTVDAYNPHDTAYERSRELYWQQLQYTVLSLECGYTGYRKMTGDLGKPINGNLCAAQVKVTNMLSGAESTRIGKAVLLSKNGISYPSITELSTQGYAAENPSKDFLWDGITRPMLGKGESDIGTVWWDVPANIEVDRLILHVHEKSPGGTIYYGEAK